MNEHASEWPTTQLTELARQTFTDIQTKHSSLHTTNAIWLSTENHIRIIIPTNLSQRYCYLLSWVISLHTVGAYYLFSYLYSYLLPQLLHQFHTFEIISVCVWNSPTFVSTKCFNKNETIDTTEGYRLRRLRIANEKWKHTIRGYTSSRIMGLDKTNERWTISK